MSLPKITDTEKGQYGVTLLPNVPTITANALKQKFEEKSDDLIIPRHNELIDALVASTGASEIGAEVGERSTTIQGAVDTILQALSEKQDTLTFDETPTDGSANPVTSDGIYEALVSLSNGIQTVINTLQPKSTAVTHTQSTAVGSTKKGVYVDTDGTVKAMTYEVNKSVPSDAKFSDTTYSAGTNISIDENNRISVTGGAGAGDMLKAVYDTNDDGIVDKASTLDGLTASVEELNLLEGANSNIQDQIDGKQATLTFDNAPTKNSNNPVKSGGIKTAIDNSITTSENLLSSTVGWDCRNELHSPSSVVSTGIFTVNRNAEGELTSVAVSGDGGEGTNLFLTLNANISDGNYILSGCPSGGSSSSYRLVASIYSKTDGSYIRVVFDFGEGGAINLASNEYIKEVYIRISGSVTKTFTPMISKAEYGSTPFQPYHASVEQTLRDAEVIEGKNLLELPYGTKSGYTASNVTFTVLEDGTVVANTPSGQAATENAFFVLIDNTKDFDFDSNQYILSGCPSDGGSSKYELCYRIGLQSDDSYVSSVSDFGNGNGIALTSFDKTTQQIRIYIAVRSGQVCNNLKFKPMICTLDEWNKSREYEPYYIPLKDSMFPRAEQRVLGAKNLLANIPTTLSNGITTSLRSDGGYDSSGTIASVNYRIVDPDTYSYMLPVGEYILSVKMTDTTNKLRLSFVNGSTWTSKCEISTGEEARFSVTQADLTSKIALFVGNSYTINQSVSNTLYIMIRLASDPDDTYAPYVMTNRKLTEAVFKKTSLKAGDDLNDIDISGMYDILSQPTNSPTSYAALLVNKRSDTGISQVIFKNDSIYIRSYGGSPAVWGSWYKLTGTVVL